MVTNDQIRRARPSVDSPLGRLIKGEIDLKQYKREILEKRARETGDSDSGRQAASER